MGWQHFLGFALVALIAYYIGANHKLGLPIIG